MAFRTELIPSKSPMEIGYSDSILTIGSCFAQNMGNRLEDVRFNTLINPFGILYNPISIAHALDFLLKEDLEFTEKDIFKNGDLWHSWRHHGRFSHPEKAVILRGMNESLEMGRAFLKKTNRLVITLGTANAHVLKEDNMVVANCHKVPSQYFYKKLLKVEEIVENFNNIFRKMNTQNADIQIVMTVSPIRHIKDGLVENQLSKATLRLAIEELCSIFNNIHYFPAYEIMMDDLRDYRFYEPDMIHPTTQAIDYIWDFFTKTYFNTNTIKIVDDVKKLNAMQNHRPLHPDTEGYQQFVKSLGQKVLEMKNKYPFLNL